MASWKVRPLLRSIELIFGKLSVQSNEFIFDISNQGFFLLEGIVVSIDCKCVKERERENTWCACAPKPMNTKRNVIVIFSNTTSPYYQTVIFYQIKTNIRCYYFDICVLFWSAIGKHCTICKSSTWIYLKMNKWKSKECGKIDCMDVHIYEHLQFKNDR